MYFTGLYLKKYFSPKKNWIEERLWYFDNNFWSNATYMPFNNLLLYLVLCEEQEKNTTLDNFESTCTKQYTRSM